MSIQGRVNHLFTITGAFAGLYGQQHPEIQEGRQLKKVTSETAQQIDKGLEELPKSLSEMNENQLNILEDKANIITNTANKFIDKVRENPSLLKDKQIKKDYEELIKDPDLVELKQLKENIGAQRENLRKPKVTMKDIVSKYQAKGWNIGLASDMIKQDQVSASNPNKRIVVNPYVKATQSLEMEGSNKVLQQKLQDQRRKDKGEI